MSTTFAGSSARPSILLCFRARFSVTKKRPYPLQHGEGDRVFFQTIIPFKAIPEIKPPYFHDIVLCCIGFRLTAGPGVSLEYLTQVGSVTSVNSGRDILVQ